MRTLSLFMVCLCLSSVYAVEWERDSRYWALGSQGETSLQSLGTTRCANTDTDYLPSIGFRTDGGTDSVASDTTKCEWPDSTAWVRARAKITKKSLTNGGELVISYDCETYDDSATSTDLKAFGSVAGIIKEDYSVKNAQAGQDYKLHFGATFTEDLDRDDDGDGVYTHNGDMYISFDSYNYANCTYDESQNRWEIVGKRQTSSSTTPITINDNLPAGVGALGTKSYQFWPRVNGSGEVEAKLRYNLRSNEPYPSLFGVQWQNRGLQQTHTGNDKQEDEFDGGTVGGLPFSFRTFFTILGAYTD